MLEIQAVSPTIASPIPNSDSYSRYVTYSDEVTGRDLRVTYTFRVILATKSVAKLERRSRMSLTFPIQTTKNQTRVQKIPD